MKRRVMIMAYDTINPVAFENLLVNKPTLRKTLRTGIDKDGRDFLQVDVVTEDDAHMQGFYNQAKALLVKGTIHIHKCMHKEYGEPVDKPCVIIEEIEL